MGFTEKFTQELEKLRGAVLRPLVFFFAIFVCLIVLSAGEVVIKGREIPMFVFGAPSLATQIFISVKTFLIPETVPLVALGPIASFVAPMMMSLLIASLVTFPYALYSIENFLRPALYPRERTIIYRILLPAMLLFYFGATLGYFFVIPTTFSILYSFAEPIGVVPYFSLDTFVSSVFLLTISVGFIFLLPIFIIVLTRLGVVPHEMWLKSWKGAIVTALIFSALVTPDGTGITMLFLFIPLMVLYIIGIVLSRKKKTMKQ